MLRNLEADLEHWRRQLAVAETDKTLGKYGADRRVTACRERVAEAQKKFARAIVEANARTRSTGEGGTPP